jgi:transposase InsO family protein
MEPLVGIAPSCELTGVNRASRYRWRNPGPKVVGPRPAPTPHPASLDATERAKVLEVLRSDRFADKSPAQVWAVTLDEGTYLCSVSTMYRLLRQAGEVRERRAQATHPAKVKPELMADGPDQVWSWDITKLKGPFKGVYYDLFVMIDIFSRKVIHWMLATRETAELAEQFFQDSFRMNGGIVPDVVHADRGTSMTSKNVAQLLVDLNIVRSHSRPKVSNDNPYSEANFKTLKYCPAFPGRFVSFEAAEEFSERFFTYYNTEHRHSGIGLHTPASVHDGTATKIRQKRAEVLAAAYAANPGRFRAKPIPPRIPDTAAINPPPANEEETTQNSESEQAA